VMMPPGEQYIFGRVMGTNLQGNRAPMPGAHLIYVYRWQSKSNEPDRSRLNPQDMLLPPLFINDLPWSKGYFETVAHWPLGDSDLLPQHCFWDALRDCYVNDKGEDLPSPVEPCGDWGLHSYRTFDDALSEALAIPLAAE
jgi:hypothetical protein